MSRLVDRVRSLVRAGEIRISEHGYEELVEDGLTVRELVSGTDKAVVVEEYPTFRKGPCILLLQEDRSGRPVHVLWGIPKGHRGPAVLVTAYRPDPERWDSTLTERR